MSAKIRFLKSLNILWGAIFLLVSLVACAQIETVRNEGAVSDVEKKRSRLKNSEASTSGGLFSSSGENSGGGGIGVNSFLWRATLDTISFMPVTSADAFGGVVLTDWRASSEAPNERFKMNIYLLGRQLRADGIRVAVFRQVLDNNIWRDADVPEETRTKIEDAILTRARQLRNEALGQQ